MEKFKESLCVKRGSAHCHVRDNLYSLYTDYPTIYLIISQNKDMKHKDVSLSVDNNVIIDDQPRTTAIMTV